MIIWNNENDNVIINKNNIWKKNVKIMKIMK